MKNALRNLGPGFLLAATGVGAGDMLAAATAGASFGVALVWAPLFGALLKCFLSEGIARWQISSGETLLRSVVKQAPRPVAYLFALYLTIWGFMAAAAMMSACGLAAHSLFPAIELKTWAIFHSIAALLIVWFGRYRVIEAVMKFFVGILVTTIIVSVVRVGVDWGQVVTNLVRPRLSSASALSIMALIGGVGGSVTLLSYSYWLREKAWESPESLPLIRSDLIAAYLFVGCFGASMLILSARIGPGVLSGDGIILAIADEIARATNEGGKVVFLVGFWGAVFSSIVGVWDGIPYLFDDFVSTFQGRSDHGASAEPRQKSLPYRAFLCFLAVPPMALLFAEKPVAIVIAYTIAGSLFMPLLATSLLYFNNFRIQRPFQNGVAANLVIAFCLVLFVVLGATKIREIF